MALCKVPRTVTVAIAGRWTTFDTRPNVPVSYFEMPFDSKISGAVTIAMNGMTTEGPPIMNEWTEDEVSSTSHLSGVFQLSFVCSTTDIARFILTLS